jgi:hypothetical protein
MGNISSDQHCVRYLARRYRCHLRLCLAHPPACVDAPLMRSRLELVPCHYCRHPLPAYNLTAEQDLNTQVMTAAPSASIAALATKANLARQRSRNTVSHRLDP